MSVDGCIPQNDCTLHIDTPIAVVLVVCAKSALPVMMTSHKKMAELLREASSAS